VFFFFFKYFWKTEEAGKPAKTAETRLRVS